MTFVLSGPDHSSGPERDKRSCESGLACCERRSPRVLVSRPGALLCAEFAIKLYSSDRRRSTLGKPNQAQNSVFKALAERRGRLRLYSCRAAYVPFVPFARSDGLRLDVGFASISVGAASS